MTRKNAREIALGCIFESLNRACPPEEIVAYRLDEPGLSDLAAEDPVFAGRLSAKDRKYIEMLVHAAVMNAEKYFNLTDAFSESWSSRRVARMTRAILVLAMAEIEYGNDVPPSVAINEAVELAKKYDTEKAPAYINGILGSYVRSIGAEKPPAAEKEPMAAAMPEAEQPPEA